MMRQEMRHNAQGSAAASLKQSASLLRDLADSVSRGREDAVDVPRELRRIAARLEGGCEGSGRVSGLAPRMQNEAFPEQFRNEVVRLRLQLQHRRQAGTPVRETEARMTEMEQLLRRLCTICGELQDGMPEMPGSRAGGTHVGLLSPTSAAAKCC